MAGMEATFPLAFQGISHFSLLKHMVFFLITAATSHWERGKETCLGPSFVRGRSGRGEEGRGVSLSRVRGLLSAAPLPRWACVCPSPQWLWPIVRGSREGSWSPIALVFQGARPVPSPENVFPVLWQDPGRGCQVS